MISEELGRRLEFDVGGSLAIGLAPGGREHGGRPIDGGDSSRPPRERDGEAADAAAVLERGHGREFRHEAQAHEAQQPLDVHLAAREELPLAIRRHVRAQELRGRQHGEVRLARGERLPAPVGFAARACLRGSSRENRRDHSSPCHPRYPAVMSRIQFRKRIAVVALAALTAACADRQTSESPVLPRDVHSYAQPEKARVTHVSLDLAPDFTAHKLAGTATLSIARAQGADSIVLDSGNLTIKRVSDGAGAPLVFNTGTAKEFLGSPLTIMLPGQGDTIVIEYETSPTASAVQWLSPEQTAGKKLPFLFTQGQAILTRSWVPTQDSPGIRQTYDATIRVPAGMRAVMSADHVQPEGEKDSLGRAVFRFRMDKPIPPYLVALAIGDIAFKPIGTQHGCVRRAISARSRGG